MASAAEGPPVIAFPERVDRRLRLGPFPSYRHALKFVGYAAAGALVSPITTAWAWVPFAGLGLVFSIWCPDGQAIDERGFRFIVWRTRSLRSGRTDMMRARPLQRQGLLQLSGRRYLAVVRTGGAPMAYLPPEELARRFELYRELLQSVEGSFAWLASTTPIRAQAVRPGPAVRANAEARAVSGYSELVTVLCRRRLLRRVYIVLGVLDASSDAVGHLEGRIAGLMERLGALGLRPQRLRDRPLLEAARRFGWTVEGGSG